MNYASVDALLQLRRDPLRDDPQTWALVTAMEAATLSAWAARRAARQAVR